MKQLSTDEIAIITNLLKLHEYKYSTEFIGVTEVWESAREDGSMCFCVKLIEDEEDFAFANHVIEVGDHIISLHELQNSQRFWFIDEDELLFEELIPSNSELFVIISNIIQPFDFESYAIDNFDFDIVSESIPYGDPYCLVIDGAVFLFEEKDKKMNEKEIVEFLTAKGWAKERINKSIIEGYEYTDDVNGTLMSLPIVYVNDAD